MRTREAAVATGLVLDEPSVRFGRGCDEGPLRGPGAAEGGVWLRPMNEKLVYFRLSDLLQIISESSSGAHFGGGLHGHGGRPSLQGGAAARCICRPEGIDEGYKIRTIYDGSIGGANDTIRNQTMERTMAPTVLDGQRSHAFWQSRCSSHCGPGRWPPPRWVNRLRW